MTEAPPLASPPTTRRQTRLHLLVLVALPFLVFSNTLENDYQLDSVHRIKRNTEIERLWPPWRFFTDRRTGSQIQDIAEYRPLMPLTHSIETALADALGLERRAVFHAGNIALHVTTTLLLYLLFGELLTHWGRRRAPPERARRAALGAALLFAVHPVSGVPVNYLAGRDLLLMMAFLTAALLRYARMRRRGESVGAWATVLALLALSMLSKGNAVVAFAVVFLFEALLARARPTDWRPWARVGACLALSWLFLLVQDLSGLGWQFASPAPARGVAQEEAVAERLVPELVREATASAPEASFPLTMLKAHLFHYLRNFAWPFEIRMLPRFPRVGSWTDLHALAGGAFILSSLVLAGFLLRRNSVAAFAILSYWTLFSVTSSLFGSAQTVEDYRQYPSLAFLCLLVSIGLFALPRAAAMAALPALVAYFALASHSLNANWRDSESFWHQSVRHGGSALAHTNYGFSVVTRDPALAEWHYLEALRIHPNHVRALTNLGMLYVRQGRAEEGLERLREAVRAKPGWSSPHYWLGRALLELGRQEEGLKELKRATRLDPRSLRYQYEVARALHRAGDLGGSLPHAERVIAIDPGYEDVLFLAGFAHQMAGRRERAVADYRRFLEHRPDHARARFNLGYALKKQGQCAEAVDQLERVLELDPKRVAAHLHLADCYRQLGRTSESDRHAAAWEGEADSP